MTAVPLRLQYLRSSAITPAFTPVFTAIFVAISAAALLVLCAAPTLAQSGNANNAGPAHDDGRPLEILFLGHNSEHHNSSAFYPLLAGPLAKHGIHLTYVEDPEEALNDETLRWYDGVLLYANHDSITASQESALLSFVENGGAFIPVHSASYCFRNSDAFVSLVGGQFLSHGSGTFSAETVKPQHPIVAGLETFETWDETYVHTHVGRDIDVLMERVDETGREPYTWTRTQGQGRIFYTAFGHDERTWGNPGFHALLERGIVWAVADDVREQWEAFAVPAPEYVEAPLPNYEKRDPNLLMQRPLSAEESQRLIHVPPMFRLELFASEPMIINPITMAFDERGRLWVVETTDYPNLVRDDSAGDDRIKIIEDTDGDGRADKVTVFADGLNIPTSLTFSNGGVIVAQAPHFLFLMDTDGDDVADVREVLMTGWSTSDTHAGPSQLQYGLDNHIWGSVGYAGFDGSVGGEPHQFYQGFFRFTPDARSMEFLTRTSNNTWGLGFSEEYDVFGSTANNAPSWYMAIPNRQFEGVRGLQSPLGSKGIATFYAMHPLTANVRQVDVFGGFTAAAGHHLYTARSFPKSYWNRAALITEPTGHLVARGIVTPEGSGFRTNDGGSLLNSADEWVSPIHAQVGPDGAVWVLDWYNFIVQHNPTPQGFDTGKGNAYVTDLRDKQRGRIYRIVYRDAPESKQYDLTTDDPAALVDGLRADNMFWRSTAQRLLVERGRKDVASDLAAIARDASVDEIGINAPAVHALWTMHGLGLLDGTNESAMASAYRALAHPAPGVRKAAIAVLPNTDSTQTLLLNHDLLHDTDARVRLAATLKLAETPTNGRAGSALYGASRDRVVFSDPWLGQATYLAATNHADGFLAAWRADAQRLAVASLPRSLSGDDAPVDWHESAPASLADWPTMDVPGVWEEKGYEDLDGWLWYIRVVDGSTSNGATLHLGMVNNDEETWVNGIKVGASQGWDAFRTYHVTPSVWNDGPNVIAVRVYDSGGTGGFHGEPDSMYVEEAGRRTQSLAGDWHYRIERRINTVVEYSAPGELAAHVARHYGTDEDRMAGAVDSHSGDASVTANNKDASAATQTDAPAEEGTRIVLKTIPQKLAFDQTAIRVDAGATLELVFENNDLLQHNVVVIRPGTLDEVGAAADALARTPGADASGYVPRLSAVLGSTALVDPGQSATIRMRVPDEPGEYPFVCTFPGHWRLMRGILIVE